MPQHILPGASASCAPTPVVAPIDDRTSSIWSFQRIQGRPLRRFPQIPASNTRHAGASSSIRATWPSQRRCWILICCTTTLRSSYSSLLNQMRKHRQLALDRRSYVLLFSRILSRPQHQCSIMSTIMCPTVSILCHVYNNYNNNCFFDTTIRYSAHNRNFTQDWLNSY